VLGQIASNQRYGRPDDYILQYKARNEAIQPADVTAAARTLQPAALTWVVVGDLSKIEQPVRALGLGEVSVLDADGKPRHKE
jgi:predicted Zn-dependent peptidase